MMNPSIIRAVSSIDLRRPLRAAIEALAVATKENTRLRAELADRDAMLKELQEMIGRLA